MLRIITGRAGAGKTSGIMEELRADIAAGLAGRLLLVPEQFSHEAERELAHAAGPGLALCAEVLSFTGLARRLEAEAGPGGRSALTAGGRLLCMALAVDNVCTSLRVYARARRSPEMQLELLGALDELTAAEIGPARLMEAAERAPRRPRRQAARPRAALGGLRRGRGQRAARPRRQPRPRRRAP